MGQYMPLFNEKRCPVCKKIFYPTYSWAYKHNEKHYCSWKCLRTAEKKSEEEKKYKWLPVEQYTLGGELVKTHKNIMEAALDIGGCYTNVAAACKGKKYKGYLWRYKE